MRELVFNVAVYGVPLLLFILLPVARPPVRRLAVLVFFLVPLSGELAFLLSSRILKTGLDVSLGTILVLYPYALVPFGLWAVLLGTAGALVVEFVHRRFELIPVALFLVPPFAGALVGYTFIGLLLWQDAAGSTAVASEHNLPWYAAGIAAGIAGGVLSVWFVAFRSSNRQAGK